MTAPLTLPGDIPGLLRRGSPVCDPASGEAGIVLYVDGDDVGVFAGWDQCELDTVALDLSDPTGLHHAVMLLVPKQGHRVNGAFAVVRVVAGVLVLHIEWPSGERCFTGDGHEADESGWEHVPGLAEIDPDDCDALPRAVAACVLHIAGREVTA